MSSLSKYFKVVSSFRYMQVRMVSEWRNEKADQANIRAAEKSAEVEKKQTWYENDPTITVKAAKQVLGIDKDDKGHSSIIDKAKSTIVSTTRKILGKDSLNSQGLAIHDGLQKDPNRIDKTQQWEGMQKPGDSNKEKK